VTTPLKDAIAGLLDISGLLRAAEAAWDSRNVVFALHRVIPPAEMDECYNPYLAISPEVFDDFLTWVQRRHAVVPLHELLSRSSNRTKGRACALTFDDGWEDNFRVALPILRQHDVPATVYVATGMIGTRRILPEESLWRLQRGATPEQKEHISRTLTGNGKGDAPAIFKRLPYAKKIELLNGWGGVLDLERASFMDWKQVREMSAHGITFGSHTVNHVILPFEESSNVEAELTASQAQLSAQLGHAVKDFAFPNGGFDDRTLALVQAAGYEVAVTTMGGAVRQDTDPFRIPRLPMDDLVVRNQRGAFSRARARLHVVRATRSAENTPQLY
jgi:peptidoglycan/xylan/chitin deacetylase (PgdA/CDA1 family)